MLEGFETLRIRRDGVTLHVRRAGYERGAAIPGTAQAICTDYQASAGEAPGLLLEEAHSFFRSNP